MERLFANRPTCTDGRLTKNNLYKEAGVSRASMNRATAILTEWDSRMAARTVDNPPSTKQDEEIRILRNELKKTKDLADRLQQQLDAAATVIGALHADNTALRERMTHHSAPVFSMDRARAGRE
jgi:hypothetical protein